MRLIRHLSWVSALLAAAAPATTMAHHAAAPHFIMERTITFEGTVQSWRPQNPHSYMLLTVRDASGVNTWRCETGGIGLLQRSSVTARTFFPGQKITVSAAPGRHDPHICDLRGVQLPDGKSIRFGANGAQPRPAVVKPNESMYGLWTRFAGAAEDAVIAQSSSRNPGVGAPARRSPMLDFLTPAGQRAVAAYDALRDDPARACSPVVPRRLWAAPGAIFQIAREGQTIRLHYDFMDAVRLIHLDQKDHSKAGPRTVLGHSIGRFEGDTLVVDTAHFAPGVVEQYTLDDKGRLTGVMHSDAYHVVERIRFDPASHQLQVSASSSDPKFYTKPFPDLTWTFEATPAKTVARYNCKPDVEVGRQEARRAS